MPAGPRYHRHMHVADRRSADVGRIAKDAVFVMLIEIVLAGARFQESRHRGQGMLHQVLADAGKIVNHRNLQLLQCIRRTNPTAHQQGRSVDAARRR